MSFVRWAIVTVPLILLLGFLAGRVVPEFTTTIRFEQGAREIVAWHDADPARRTVDARMDAVMDDLVARFRVG